MDYRSRMFMDVDGVLNADRTPPFAESAQKAVFINHGGGLRSKYWMNYAPEVIQRLDAIREDYAVELVWLTTWCEDEQVRKLPSAFNGLWDGRIYPVDQLPASSEDKRLWTAWKAEAVEEDTARDPLPFSWSDDEAPAHHQTSLETRVAVPSCIIAPDPRQGLTPETLDALEQFHRSFV